jgi:hypothetical protein
MKYLIQTSLSQKTLILAAVAKRSDLICIKIEDGRAGALPAAGLVEIEYLEIKETTAVDISVACEFV